jgi:ATP-binding cassette subfamily F protein 3
MEKIAPAHIDSPFTFRFSQAEKTSDPLLSLEKSDLGYTENPTLSAVNLTLRADSRIGLLGPNGAGKSTLVKTLVGDLALINGLRHASEHLKVGYFAQHQLEYLDLQASAILHIQRLSPKVSEQIIRNFLGSFNFHGDKAVAAIKPFSGGEKARLALAIIVWQKPNLLILDEPTNHLDLEMRHALTLALQLYQGALIIISHDRHLLKNTVDDFYLVAQRTLQFFDGDLSDYQIWLKEVLQKSNVNSDVGGDDEDNKGIKLAEEKIDKKSQRQQDAAHREKLKPLTNNIKKLERTITKKQAELEKVEGELADQDLYTDDNKKKLQALLQQQRQLQSAINTLEDDWLVAQEELEIYSEI